MFFPNGNSIVGFSNICRIILPKQYLVQLFREIHYMDFVGSKKLIKDAKRNLFQGSTVLNKTVLFLRVDL